MQAVVYHRYGGPDVLECREIDVPVPSAGEVLVRVQCAAVNPYDWHFMRGTPGFLRLFTGLRRPKFPRLGADAAGIVEAVGPGSTHLEPGDRVFGACRGAFARFACGKEAALALIPPGVSFAQAASLPIAGVTALQALRDRAQVKAGQTVLINGAAGGVGSFAVSIAKGMGATVTGVCSTRNVEMVRGLGADRVIDYTRQDFTRTGERFDAIFDLVGNQPLRAILRALTPRGVFVGCGGGGPDTPGSKLLLSMLGQAIAAPFSSRKLTSVLAKINTADLAILARMVESGAIHPALDRSYPLSETAAAIRYIEGGHARGKVTIAVA